jgi:hypothetical protein
VIAVDPDGSILANPSCKETHAYEVEGIGYGQSNPNSKPIFSSSSETAKKFLSQTVSCE